MSVAEATAETCRLGEHAIFAVLDFPCAWDAHYGQIAALSASAVDRGGARGMIHGARGVEADAAHPLFGETELPLSNDLHPVVRTALAERGEAGSAVRCLGLTDHGHAVLNGDWARPPGDPRRLAGWGPGRGLALLLGRDQRARVRAAGGADAPCQRIALERLDIVPFRSGTALAVLRLRLQGPERLLLAHLQETLHSLSHARRTPCLGWACEAEPKARFTLPDLLWAVLEPADCAPAARSRLYTYSYAQLVEPPADRASLDIAAWRLSRHYTDAYEPGAGYAAGTAVLHTFRGVVHAASLEGAATLTVPDSAFLHEGFGARVRDSYLPLALLGFHERVELLRIAHRAAEVPLDARGDLHATDERSAETLRQLIDGFLAFRLRYRLPFAGDITMHNQFYEAVREGLKVEQLARKILEDTREAALALQDRRAAASSAEERARHAAYLRRERRRAWVVAFFAGMLTFLTALNAIQTGHELWGERSRAVMIALAVAILLALLFGVVTGVRHADSHSDRVGAEPNPRHSEAEVTRDGA